MRVEKEVKLNDWLLGVTILCKSCGCLWLVPNAQTGETYRCRQCGSKATMKGTDQGVKQDTTNESEATR